jgi:hypothetical protein
VATNSDLTDIIIDRILPGIKGMNEEIGEALREGLQAKLEVLGQAFVVHYNFTLPDAYSVEVVGLTKPEGKSSGRMVFQFLDPFDVQEGSILQIKGARDYWKVIDTEDVVEYGTLVRFEVYVEKVNVAGQPSRSPSGRIAKYQTEIHLSNSTIGILNTGEIEDVQSISVNASSLTESGHAEMAKAIKELTEAVAANQELLVDQRAFVLQNLEELSRQALLPQNERLKSGVITSLLSGVGVSLNGVAGLAQIWSTWGTTIGKFFGL